MAILRTLNHSESIGPDHDEVEGSPRGQIKSQNLESTHSILTSLYPAVRTREGAL